MGLVNLPRLPRTPSLHHYVAKAPAIARLTVSDTPGLPRMHRGLGEVGRTKTELLLQ